MKKLCKCCLLSFLLISLTSSPVAAHSGRTDSNGGHNKTSDGTYHYHLGTDRTIEYATPQNTKSSNATQNTSVSPNTEFTYTPRVEKDVPIVINGEQLDIKEPLQKDGPTILLPLVPIIKALGYEDIQWIGETQEIIIKTSDDMEITIQVGEIYVYHNKIKSELDVAPRIANDRTYVSARFLTDNFNVTILTSMDFDAVKGTSTTIIITSNADEE